MLRLNPPVSDARWRVATRPWVLRRERLDDLRVVGHGAKCSLDGFAVGLEGIRADLDSSIGPDALRKLHHEADGRRDFAFADGERGNEFRFRVKRDEDILVSYVGIPALRLVQPPLLLAAERPKFVGLDGGGIPGGQQPAG